MKNNVSSEILNKQFLVMTGEEIIELFSHILPINSDNIAGYVKDVSSDYICGIAGLADFLNCGKTKAQSVVNSGKIDTAIHRIGKKIFFHREKINALRQEKNF